MPIRAVPSRGRAMRFDSLLSIVAVSLITVISVLACPAWGEAPDGGTRAPERRWLYEVVEKGNMTGGNMPMLFDANDIPHIVYGSSNGITHASFDGTAWSMERVPGTTSDNGELCAVLDGSGMPHICYYSHQIGLNYTWKDGFGWHSITVDGEYQTMGSLGIDRNGTAHIAYRSGSRLRHAECRGAEVNISTLGTGNFYGISLAVDSTGRVCISASNRSAPDPNKLEFFQRTAFGWGRMTIPQGQGAFTYTILRFDAEDRPYICFTVRDGTDRLEMVRLVGSAWSNSTVDPELDWVVFDFLVGTDGSLHTITDHDTYGRYTGMAWTEEVIDLENFSWRPLSMGMDGLGNLHIASMVTDGGVLSLVHATHGFENNRPVANAGEDRELDLGGIMELDGGSSSDDTDIARFIWRIEVENFTIEKEGRTAEMETFMLGVHTVTLRVVDTSGNFDDDEALLTVKDLTAPDAEAGEDIMVDQHAIVQFDGSLSHDRSAELNFTWVIGYVRTVTLYGPAPAFRFDEAGSFEVVLHVADPSGNVGVDRIDVTVLDTTPPEVFHYVNVVLPQFSMLQLNGSLCSDNVGIEVYNWTIVMRRSTWYFEGQRASFGLDEAGEYDVILAIWDGAGLRNSTSFTVLSLDREKPEAVFDCPNMSSIGAVVQLDGTGSIDNMGIVNWTWEIRGPSGEMTSYSAITGFTPTEPGNHTITLTVEDSEGNEGSMTMQVLVTEPVPTDDDDSGSERESVLPLLLGAVLFLLVASCIVLALVFRRKAGTETPEDRSLGPGPGDQLTEANAAPERAGKGPGSTAPLDLKVTVANDEGARPSDIRTGRLMGDGTEE